MHDATKQAVQRKQVIFLDFDHTLFDSDLFFHVEVWEEIEKLGIKREVWEETYEAVWESGYSLHKHIAKLRERISPRILQQIDDVVHEKFTDLSRFLFSDVISFLASIPKEKYDVHLLSFGSPEWQIYKVNGSGLVKYFDGLFFTLSYRERKARKIRYLGKAYDGGIVVDNSPRELDAMIDEGLGFKTYFINRVPQDFRAKDAAERRRYYEAVRYVRDKHEREHQACRGLSEIEL